MSEDQGGALGDVREAFSGTRGKVLLVGGAVAIAAYVWWTRRNGTPDAVPGDTTVDGPSGRSPQTDPSVGNTDTTSGNGPATRRYSNNADWLADATTFLQGRGTPSGAAYNALTKALGGQALTAQEAAWVSQAIGALGAPPEGMPPLSSSAPTTPAQTALKAPAGLRATGSTRTSITLDWQPVAGASGYRLYVGGKQNGSTVLYSSGTVRYLKPNTSYTVSVAAVRGSTISPKSSVTARTKK